MWTNKVSYLYPARVASVFIDLLLEERVETGDVVIEMPASSTNEDTNMKFEPSNSSDLFALREEWRS